MSSNNLYDILEIKKEASHNEIKKQYKILALKWHPDKNQSNKVFAENKFKEISKAYEILGDPDKKKLYDSNKNILNKNNNIFKNFNTNIGSFNVNINNINNMNFNNMNFMSTTKSSKIIDGDIIENITINQNGKITKIIKKNGEIILQTVINNNTN